MVRGFSTPAAQEAASEEHEHLCPVSEMIGREREREANETQSWFFAKIN